jgi:hypothetical protein
MSIHINWPGRAPALLNCLIQLLNKRSKGEGIQRIFRAGVNGAFIDRDAPTYFATCPLIVWCCGRPVVGHSERHSKLPTIDLARETQPHGGEHVLPCESRGSCQRDTSASETERVLKHTKKKTDRVRRRLCRRLALL